jgi:glutamate-1-semialdehyde 2,1-aminomutase
MMHCDTLKQKAFQLSPGGVQSPVRYLQSRDDVLFFDRASGCTLWDPEGHEWLDYVGGYGPMILGHAHPDVVAAMVKQSRECLSMGACHRLEAQLAECIQQAMPHLEMVRFVNSGTEAAMTAIRLARGITGRNGILKFNGGYHGHVDALLVNAGSGALTLNQPSSPGIPKDTTRHTHTLPYNDLNAVTAYITEHGQSIAALIVEPIAGNMGMIKPLPGFLSGLRSLCDQYGILLIMDEVMTGFRVAFGGAQSLYNVQGDITLLGKIIGGGLPVGALAGSARIMNQLAPKGPIYQAGTLSGNPMTMAAGLATLTALQSLNPYAERHQHAAKLGNEMAKEAHQAGVPFSWVHEGAMMGLFFSESAPCNQGEVMQSNRVYFELFLSTCLSHRIFWPPSPFESAFLSITHNQQSIDKTILAWQDALDSIKTHPSYA